MNQTMIRRTIDAFYSRMTKGTRLTCIANTGNTQAIGITATVDQPARSIVGLVTDDGQRLWLSAPRYIGDVVHIDSDTITYQVGREGQTVTWRIDA